MVENEEISIVQYDPAWAAKFDTEKALLEKTLGTRVSGGIHHVGSTSVPILRLLRTDWFKDMRDLAPALDTLIRPLLGSVPA